MKEHVRYRRFEIKQSDPFRLFRHNYLVTCEKCVIICQKSVFLEFWPFKMIRLTH